MQEVESLYRNWKNDLIGTTSEVIIKVTTALGYSSLKREQCGTAEQFVFGHDVFISLPTGGGKRAV